MDKIDNVIQTAFTSNRELASIKEQLNVLKLEMMESVDTMNDGVKQSLKQHLIKVEGALNKINEQTIVNQVVIKHILLCLITPPDSEHYNTVWVDAKNAFTEFLKDGYEKQNSKSIHH